MVALPFQDFRPGDTLRKKRKIVAFGDPGGAAVPAVEQDEGAVVARKVEPRNQPRRGPPPMMAQSNGRERIPFAIL